MGGKRTKTQETAKYVKELLKRIPLNDYVSASKLKEQLDSAGYVKDIRTLQRHLTDLELRGEITSEGTTRKTYKKLPIKHNLFVNGLTPNESLFMTLAQEHLRYLLPAKLMQSMESFFDQAKSNLTKDLSNLAKAKLEREWKTKVRVVADIQPLIPPKIAEGVFEAVSDALYNNFWLDVRFHNASGYTNDYKIMPMGLAQQGTCLYLVCRFDGYDNNRNLAVHRIESAKSTNLPFERPTDFDLEKYDKQGGFGFGEGKQVALTFHVKESRGKFLHEARLSEDQVITKLEDGTLEVKATVVASALLDKWLRGLWAFHIEKVAVD